MKEKHLNDIGSINSGYILSSVDLGDIHTLSSQKDQHKTKASNGVIHNGKELPPPPSSLPSPPCTPTPPPPPPPPPTPSKELRAVTEYGSREAEEPPTPKKDAVEEKVQAPKIQLRDKIALALFLFVSIVSSCKMALPAPFFPQEAAKKGASTTEVGLVFSVFELVVFISSPLIGRYTSKLGLNFVYVAGTFMSGASTVLFGLLYMGPGGSVFVTLALLVRAMEALGFACQSTSLVATMCYYFPNNYASVYAFACSITSIGAMLGPPIGAVFYEIGGFGLPFWIMGGIPLAMEPIFLFIVPDIKAEPHKSSHTKSVFLLAKSGLVWAGVLGLFMSAVGNVFLAPTLAKHLQEYGLGHLAIGMCFALHPIIYTLFTPVLGFLADRMDLKTPLLLASSIGCCVAFALIGPSPLFPFLPRSVWVILSGYMLLGISEAGLTIPTAKCLVAGASELGFPTGISTFGMMSGLNVAGYHFGAFVGPLLGGVLTDAMGFNYSSTVIAAIYLATGALGAMISILIAATCLTFCLILGYRYAKSKRAASKEERSPLLQDRNGHAINSTVYPDATPASGECALTGS